jgi:hypothetical protein
VLESNLNITRLLPLHDPEQHPCGIRHARYRSYDENITLGVTYVGMIPMVMSSIEDGFDGAFSGIQYLEILRLVL